MTVWTHPRLANVDCAIREHDAIADEARAAYQRRRESYPQLISAGRIERDEAQEDLQAWRHIARDWMWIAYGEGQRAAIDTLPARIAALDTAITRWIDRLMEDGGGLTKDDETQGALLCAMRWWAERERSGDWRSHPRFLAGIGHAWRSDNGHPTRGAMIAANRKPQMEQRHAA